MQKIEKNRTSFPYSTGKKMSIRLALSSLYLFRTYTIEKQREMAFFEERKKKEREKKRYLEKVC